MRDPSRHVLIAICLTAAMAAMPAADAFPTPPPDPGVAAADMWEFIDRTDAALKAMPTTIAGGVQTATEPMAKHIAETNAISRRLMERGDTLRILAWLTVLAVILAAVAMRRTMADMRARIAALERRSADTASGTASTVAPPAVVPAPPPLPPAPPEAIRQATARIVRNRQTERVTKPGA